MQSLPLCTAAGGFVCFFSVNSSLLFSYLLVLSVGFSLSVNASPIFCLQEGARTLLSSGRIPTALFSNFGPFNAVRFPSFLHLPVTVRTKTTWLLSSPT